MREHRVVAKLYVLFEIAVTASVIVCAAAAVVPRNLFEHVPRDATFSCDNNFVVSLSADIVATGRPLYSLGIIAVR
jgi:hypothetical protein